MQLKLLWFDDSARTTLEERVRPAAARYKQKFGRSPTAVLVNPGTPGAETDTVDGIQVVPSRQVMTHYFWLGEDDAHDRDPLPETG
jgi:hypothetical protein